MRLGQLIMGRGPNLTPDELGRAAAEYTRTGSFAQAAAAIGRTDESVVRKALRRVGCPDLSGVHARAVESGLRRARKALNETNAKLKEKIEGAKLSDLVSIAKGLSLTTARLEGLAELELKRRQSRLTRRKTTAEIAALEKGTSPTPEQVLAFLASLSQEQLLAMLKMLRGGAAEPR